MTELKKNQITTGLGYLNSVNVIKEAEDFLG